MRVLPVLSLMLVVAAGLTLGVSAQQAAPIDNAAEARRALAEARQQALVARNRAEGLERQAAESGMAADRSARDAAAAAARIQEAQAQIAARQADMRLIDGQREALRARLAERQAPVIRLTAALGRLTRRPLALAVLRPGSLHDTVHMRALLESMLPEVRHRTTALRSEISRSQALRLQAELAVAALRDEQGDLARRRQSLAALETRQRLALRDASGSADRESERALMLAEQARDLDGLSAELARAGALRSELAALPGPVLRPAIPGQAVAAMAEGQQLPMAAPSFHLPVQGRLVVGFGVVMPGQPASRGVTLAVGAGAQAVAPAEGRVAYAGSYKGYGVIVIVDHGGGWTSLVTGLAQADVHVGDQLVAGSPLGIAGPGRPLVSFEVRQGGVAVNPLDIARSG